MVENVHEIGEDRTLLLVDDDDAFLKRLAKAMEKRGFEVETAESVADGRAIAMARTPAFAVCDLRLEDGNGLDVVEVIRERRPDSRVVVLTGHGAIATAARQPDERGSRPLGTYPARLRAVRSQCERNRPAAQHAPPHPATHPRQAVAAVTPWTRATAPAGAKSLLTSTA